MSEHRKKKLVFRQCPIRGIRLSSLGGGNNAPCRGDFNGVARAGSGDAARSRVSAPTAGARVDRDIRGSSGPPRGLRWLRAGACGLRSRSSEVHRLRRPAGAARPSGAGGGMWRCWLAFGNGLRPTPRWVIETGALVRARSNPVIRISNVRLQPISDRRLRGSQSSGLAPLG